MLSVHELVNKTISELTQKKKITYLVFYPVKLTADKTFKIDTGGFVWDLEATTSVNKRQ